MRCNVPTPRTITCNRKTFWSKYSTRTAVPPPGEIGRLVVTRLHHFATPLLRYDIGDYAEVGDACPCGRGLPVLRRHGPATEHGNPA